MKYLVPSIGRSGSSLIWELMITGTGCPPDQINTFRKIGVSSDQVIKTHDHFRFTPDYVYRAIFMLDDISNIIASLYKKNPHFICIHLKHLNVAWNHRFVFWILIKLDGFLGKGRFRERAFCYLIEHDKFLFMKNIASWKRSPYTIFVHYFDLCHYQKETLKRISEHIDCPLEPFVVRKRKSSPDVLPQSVQEAIARNYPDPTLSAYREPVLSGIK